jgi:O-antigen/teichoic acid export membrane protein
MLSAFSKKDFTNTKWFIAEKLVQLIVGIFIIPKIFNSLGATDIGGLKYVESIVGMLAPLFFLGLAEISIREIIYKPSKTFSILSTAFYLRLASWIVVFVGLMSYLFLLDKTDLLGLYIIVSMSYLFRVTGVVEYYLQAERLVKIIFISKISALLIIASLQYYGVTHKLDVSYFAVLVALDFLIQGVIYGVIMLRKFKFNFEFPKFSVTLAKYLLKSSYPLIISNLLVSFYITIDDIFLKYYHDTEAVGIFSLVQFLVITLTWSIGFSIINALYPSLTSSYQKEDKTEYFVKISSVLRILIYLGVGIGLFFTIFGSTILEIFFIDSYESASLPLKIFSWAPLVIFTGMLFEKHLINTNQLIKNVYRFILGIVVLVILSYFLVPKWSALGASIAVLISHFMVNVGYIFLDTEMRNELRKLF